MLVKLNDKSSCYITKENNLTKVNFINKNQVIYLKDVIITIDLLNKLNGLV